MKFFKNCLRVAVVILPCSANASTFAIEARSMGMANVSVATADITTAAFGNPAMLANQRVDDDFSLLLGVGGFINDDDEVLDDIDDYQDAKNRFDAGDPQGLVDMANIVTGLNGKIIAPEVTAALAFGFAGETYSFALSARDDLISAGRLTNFDSTPAGLVDPTKNLLSFEGVVSTEIGLSIARNFDFMGRELSVGIKPKVVQYDAIFFEESILTIDDSLSDLTEDDVTVELDDVTTVDLGLAMDLSDSWRLGLSVKNLITDEFQVGSNTFKLDTEYRLGIAYHSDFVTIGLDVDLNENDPLLANPNFSGLKTQYAAVGAEFNAFDFMQVRIGASENIASDIPDGAKETTYYAGLGFWLGFNLDIAVASRDESLGAFLQTGFRF